jgi:hypothetical protein
MRPRPVTRLCVVLIIQTFQMKLSISEPFSEISLVSFRTENVENFRLERSEETSCGNKRILLGKPQSALAKRVVFLFLGHS